MYRFPGNWKNIDDLEEHLTREELFRLLETSRKLKHEDMKFQAALQGIDLDENRRDDDFEAVKARAEARIRGETVEEYELEGLINIIDEDE